MEREDRLSCMIRDYLARTGKSQRALSLAAGMNDKFVDQILAGKAASPKGTSLAKLAAAMGTTLAHLTGEAAPAERPHAFPAPGTDPMTAMAADTVIKAMRAAGERLRLARLALGLPSCAALAAETGTTAAEVEAWEAGDAPPDIRALAVLKLRRGVPIDWILLGDHTTLPEFLRAKLAERSPNPRAPDCPDALDLAGTARPSLTT